MEDLLDRERTDAAPPPLPPYLQKRRGDGRRWIVLPDIRMCHVRSKTVHDGVVTLHYIWMARWDLTTGEYEVAHVDTRKYRQWLEIFETESGVPPHIQFGGAVVANPDEPRDIYTPWVAYAKKEFY